ncbi:MAG: hypothetical protein GY854_01840 [Deltaproteobacteria bacterium]|nr:hypothetical protein [Deltaproteobacteria bacterium]
MSVLTREATGFLIRQPVGDLNQLSFDRDDAAIANTISALWKQNDTELIKAAMLDRYAQEIKTETDETTGATIATLDGGVELKTNEAMSKAINAGQFEITRMYLINGINRERATLFTEPDLSYTYDPETVEPIITEVREDSGAELGAIRWDSLADGIGSSILYFSVSGSKLLEDVVTPNQFWYAFADEIEENGEKRATNGGSLDEASLVVMQLASTSSKNRFAAWYGPSVDYPLGRHVIYETSSSWYDIPDRSDGGLEYTIAGDYSEHATEDEVANPLSLAAMKGKSYGGPVYPFSILYGDPAPNQLLPTSTTLNEISTEVDLIASVILGSAGKGARGKEILKRESGGDIPANTSEGLIVTSRGQDLTQGGWSPTHAAAAQSVIDAQIQRVCDAHSVPSALVVGDGTYPSGVAFDRMMMPLVRYRNLRVEANRPSVRRRWEIEKALINATTGKDTIPRDAKETWDPGARAFPVDQSEKIDNMTKRIAAGEADIIDMVQEMRHIDTVEAAVNFITERKELKDENPELFKKKEPEPEAPPQGGLASRLRGARGKQ